MARPASRVCRVLMTGPLAPFADAYRGGVAGARLYAVDDGQRVAAGRAAEPLAGGGWAVGGGVERRAGRGVPGLAARWWASSLRSGHGRA